MAKIRGNWDNFRHEKKVWKELRPVATTALNDDPPSRPARHVDLSGLLYFGGVEPGPKRSRAFVQGVEAAAAAAPDHAGLEGCLRDLTLDGRQE